MARSFLAKYTAAGTPDAPQPAPGPSPAARWEFGTVMATAERGSDLRDTLTLTPRLGGSESSRSRQPEARRRLSAPGTTRIGTRD
eukprot:3337367-Rhodomonas_salina.1